jgi:hypothetical protein
VAAERIPTVVFVCSFILIGSISAALSIAHLVVWLMVFEMHELWSELVLVRRVLLMNFFSKMSLWLLLL